jgi:hypothetical protein
MAAPGKAVARARRKEKQRRAAIGFMSPPERFERALS